MFECRLQEMLNEKNMNIISLSKETGIRKERLQQLANNSFTRFQLNEVDILCNFFNCKLSDLFPHKI